MTPSATLPGRLARPPVDLIDQHASRTTRSTEPEHHQSEATTRQPGA